MDFLSEAYNNVVNSPGGMDAFKQVMREYTALKAQGKKIIDCGLGESSHGLFPEIAEAGKHAIDTNQNGYVRPTDGLPELKAIISTQYSKEIGMNVQENQIIVTPGAELGLDLIFKTFLDKGDEVVIFDPFFIPFVALVQSYKATPVIIDTYETNFLPDLEELKSKITAKTKMIVINSPNNPTGMIIPHKMLDEIAEIARKKNILLLLDETYQFFDYEEKFYSPYKSYPEGSIVVRSFSKKYCMMGYKLGYIISAENHASAIRNMQFPGWGAARISNLMGIAALKSEIPEKVFISYKQKRDYIYNELKSSGICDYCPDGAFYFYIDSKGDCVDFSLKAAKRGLLVVPGFSQRSSHFRLSYGALRQEDLGESVKILKDILK